LNAFSQVFYLWKEREFFISIGIPIMEERELLSILPICGKFLDKEKIILKNLVRIEIGTLI